MVAKMLARSTRIGCTFVVLTTSLIYGVLHLPCLPSSLQSYIDFMNWAQKAFYAEPYWKTYPPLLMQGRRELDHLYMEFWYGNSTELGNSPYDYIPRPLIPGERPFRLLFLLDFPDYIQRMNSHSYEIVDAAMRHPRVVVDVWGHGWAGWDEDLSLSQNLANRTLPGTNEPVGCGYYDAYWTISNYPDQRQGWVDNAGCGTVNYHQFGDCHKDECFQEDLAVHSGNVSWRYFDTVGHALYLRLPSRSDLSMLALTIAADKNGRYAFELLDMVTYDRIVATHGSFPMQLFSHSPDAANPWDYFPLRRWSDKTHGAVLFGAVHSLYTMRPMINKAIDRNQTFITRFEHPGFTISHNRLSNQKLATYIPNHPSYKPQIQKRKEFAEAMRHAQICVFDSSMEKKAIRKYAQAFLSGCVVAADLPTEHEEAFRNFMLVLRPGASIEEINRIIYEALMYPEELQMKALAAFAYAREFLTNTRKVDRMIRDVSMYKKGERGYSVRSFLWQYPLSMLIFLMQFTYPFSLTCRKYWKFTVPWCKGPHKPIYRKTIGSAR